MLLVDETRGHGTYTAGTVNSVPLLKVGEKPLFFAPLLMTWFPQNAPNYTDLHLYFSGGNIPDPQTSPDSPLLG